jgi:P-type E1-E2 ATPase
VFCCSRLLLLLLSTANVFRDGKRITLDADQLVPGDIVAIKSGDRLPADMRLLQVSNLQVGSGCSWV